MNDQATDGLGKGLNLTTRLQGHLCDLHKTNKEFLGTTQKYTWETASIKSCKNAPKSTDLHDFTLKILYGNVFRSPYWKGHPYTWNGQSTGARSHTLSP